MENKHLLVDIDRGVMSLKLNRPETLNAISKEMHDGFTSSLAEARRNPEIRAITISGEGRSFCSGGDLKAMGKSSPIQTYDYFDNITRLITEIQELEKPVISIVHGFAAGVAVSLALACDQVIAAEDSKFVLSFSKVGLVADGGGHFLLTKAVGPHRAKELMFHGEPISAVKAHEWGMVNRLFPPDKLQEEAKNYAVKLAEGSTRAFGMIKKLVHQSLVSDLKTILDMERTVQLLMLTTQDHKEGLLAFKEKRKPEFTGE